MERLAAVERRLDAELRGRRREAARMLREARQEAARIRANPFGAGLAGRTRRLAERIRRESERRMESLRREAGALERRYDSVPEERIRETAAWIVERILVPSGRSRQGEEP